MYNSYIPNPYMANQRMSQPYNQQPFQIIGAWVQGVEGAKVPPQQNSNSLQD